VEQFASILLAEAAARSIAYSQEMFASTISAIRASGTPLAFYLAVETPRQIADLCSFSKREMVADPATIGFALENLLVT